MHPFESAFRPLVRTCAALVATVATLLGLALLSSGAATAQVSAPAAERSFVRQINAARTARGLPALATRSHLGTVARNWAATMARQNRLHHNPGLGSQVRNWRWVGENVGYGPDAASLHVAFMNSPAHRANILDRDYTEVGIGVAVANGRVWVAEVFRQPMRTSPSFTAAGYRKLSLGSYGAAVKRVQDRLGVRTSGYFGRQTRAAVQRFQRAHDLRGTGVVGRRTWSHLF